MTSHHLEVRNLVEILVVKLSKCTCALDEQAFHNCMFGIRRKASNSEGVKKLLTILADRVEEISSPLDQSSLDLFSYEVAKMHSTYEVCALKYAIQNLKSA